MTETKSHPYIKFYGRDWLGDTMLRMCEPDERGVWIDMLCVMMGAEPYGHLAVNGRALTDQETARIIGMDTETYKGILYRLIERGIPSKTESGMIYSRRLVREHERFMVGSLSGKRGGGNPALKSDKEKKPESRSHIPETKERLKVPFIGESTTRNFQPPNPEQVSEYAASINYPMDGQAWCDSYAAKGWMIGKSKMKDWKAALRNWKRNNWQPAAKSTGGYAFENKILSD